MQKQQIFKNRIDNFKTFLNGMFNLLWDNTILESGLEYAHTPGKEAGYYVDFSKINNRRLQNIDFLKWGAIGTIK